ncbi:MAG: hypothetical protein QE271_11120 [Bacteriovoracaceae bacterium]|nr:hypothetical protein [Bacteriovoracaceae bacterium]
MKLLFLLSTLSLFVSTKNAFSQALRNGNEWASCDLTVSIGFYCQDKNGPEVTNSDLINHTSKYIPKWNEPRIKQEQELKEANNAWNFREHDMSQVVNNVPQGETFFYGTSGSTTSKKNNQTLDLECSMNFGDYFYRNDPIQFPSNWYEDKKDDYSRRLLKFEYIEKAHDLPSKFISKKEFKLVESYVPACVNHIKQFCDGNLKFIYGKSHSSLESPFQLESRVRSYWITGCSLKDRK